MNLDMLYIDLRDPQPGKRYLAYKQTAQLNDLAKRYDTRGFFHSEVGSFKVLCKNCHDHISNGKVARCNEGWNFLVMCKCTKGKEKKFWEDENNLSFNSTLAVAYLKAIHAGKKVKR